MKTLLLMRHGKSDWSASDGDFDQIGRAHV